MVTHSYLTKFKKENFNVSKIKKAAKKLYYEQEIDRIVAKVLSNPNNDFLNLILSEFYSGPKTSKIRNNVKPMVVKAIEKYKNNFNANPKVVESKKTEEVQENPAVKTINIRLADIDPNEFNSITIHYVTSDPDDQIFRIAEKESKIKPYYIGEKKLITLMMKMDADVVVMTMPDIENYHIKRSYIRKDINYVYVPHGMDSLNMTMRTGSMDHYDSVLCTGKIQKEEIEKTEEVYNLPKKELVEWGYSLLDEMREDYEKMPKKENDIKSILIAPSWQKDNIVDSCLEDILDNLKGHGYKITVRPHPQHVRHMPEKMEGLKERYKDDTDIEIQTDFSSNSTVFEADLMITDWSGIAYEYAYTTCKPVLFIDTPMKIMNPEYKKIGIEPLNIWMRYEIGRVLKLDEIDKTADTAAEMLAASDTYKDSIDRFVKEYVYNLGSSASVGAKYIIQEIQKAIKRHKEQE